VEFFTANIVGGGREKRGAEQKGKRQKEKGVCKPVDPRG